MEPQVVENEVDTIAEKSSKYIGNVTVYQRGHGGRL